MPLRILCLGDIVGRPGRQVLHQKLPALVREQRVDLVIANAENIAGGSGITANLFNKIRSYGVDVVTLGDHIYRKADIVPTLQSSERVVRPANLAVTAAGRPYTVVTTNSGVPVGVFSLLGRIYMNLPADDPFAAAERVLGQMPKNVRVCVCDMHAEASSEKIAMGHWLDGRCSLIFGTHTHVPTADAKILPGGSAFISDLGMCGPYDSVLGRRKDRVLKYMTTNMPQMFDVATNDVRLCGAVAEIDPETGRAISIERVEVKGEASEQAYDADDKATVGGIEGLGYRMHERKPIRIRVRVQWHANGGYTRVVADTGHWWEVPTEAIPADLRKIGIPFNLIMAPIRSEDFDTSETLKRLLNERLVVERLDDEIYEDYH